MNPGDVKQVLYSEESIARTVRQMAYRINEDYKGKELVTVCVLKGACIFLTDLVRQLDLDVVMEFMVVSSYGSSAKSSGVVRIKKDLEQDISGKDVLVVEDIMDTGLTLKYLKKNLESRHPNSVEAAVLLRKDLGEEPAIMPKYVGMVCPNEFVVGYGLDYNERYRNLPYIGILDEKVYS
ncbi:MAG: hypoxanthine phosphoribosyltransferase [Coriobacteriales bacterium]|jgi:hypoxanthine phosphoribosyltransferase